MRIKVIDEILPINGHDVHFVLQVPLKVDSVQHLLEAAQEVARAEREREQLGFRSPSTVERSAP